MKTTCAAAVAVSIAVLSSQATPGWVIDQQFTNSTPPAGWIFQGLSNLASQYDEGGVPVHEFLTGGFLRLTTTEGGYQRSSGFYTSDWTWSHDWSMEGEFRCIPGADGLAFSWVCIDGGMVASNTAYKLLGGPGGFLGVPRNSLAVPLYGCGAYAGVSGYSLQFDTYRDDFGGGKMPQDTNYATVRFRNLSWWTDVPGSTSNFLGEPTFFVNCGWVNFRLVQEMIGPTAHFTFLWGTNLENSYAWDDHSYSSNLPALFGVSAGCGGYQATHDVRMFRVYADIVPEPGMAAAAILGFGLLVTKRKHRRALA